MILQCDSGHLNSDLLACARYRIDDQREKAYRHRENADGHTLTHVLLIVYLPRFVKDHQGRTLSFVGFQGGAWISAHIDDIHVTSHCAGITLNDAISSTISQLFYSLPFQPPQMIDPPDASNLYQSLRSAVGNAESFVSDDDFKATFETEEPSSLGIFNCDYSIIFEIFVVHFLIL